MAQSTIQGHVFDAESNRALKNASVYLANTTRGNSTSESGAFRIANLSPGHCRLIVSYVGYETQVVEVSTANALSYRVLLKPALKELDEVVFRATRLSRNQWVEYFNLFKERFIGMSDNYRFCSFEDPRVIDFYKEHDILVAQSDTILVINNSGLGYKIRFFLEKFEYNTMLIRTHYEGQFVFEPMTPKDNEEAVRWAKARLKAYYGSEMHFFRSLYNRELNNQGFYFALIEEKKTGNNEEIQRVGFADTTLTARAAIYNYRRLKTNTITNYNKILDSVKSTPQEPILSFAGDLQIQYIHEIESFNYITNRHREAGKHPQISQIKLLKPAVVQPNGQLYPADAIETSGYFNWELVAEDLPLDYDPEEDIKLTGFKILTQQELSRRR